MIVLNGAVNGDVMVDPYAVTLVYITPIKGRTVDGVTEFSYHLSLKFSMDDGGAFAVVFPTYDTAQAAWQAIYDAHHPSFDDDDEG